MKISETDDEDGDDDGGNRDLCKGKHEETRSRFTVRCLVRVF